MQRHFPSMNTGTKSRIHYYNLTIENFVSTISKVKIHMIYYDKKNYDQSHRVCYSDLLD